MRQVAHPPIAQRIAELEKITVGQSVWQTNADLHPHREHGSSAYVWHLFDRLDDLRPLLKP